MTTPIADEAVPVPDQVADEVARLRAQVDATDREIARLILSRRDLSRQIQATRVAAGEARVQHAREAQVLRTWQDVLGPDGVPMALQVLELCRGRLT